MATDSLTGAFINLCMANVALANAVPGGFWTEEVPEQVQIAGGPFAMVMLVSEIPEWTTENSYVETSTLQVVVLGKGNATVEAAVVALKAATDWVTTLSLTTAVEVKIERKRGQLGSEEVRAPDGSLLYHWIVEYEIQVVRTY